MTREYPRSVARQLHSLFRNRRDSLPIDVLHREHVDVRVANGNFLALIQVPHADDDGIGGQHLRGEAADARELGRLGPQKGRQRHPVNVAAERRAGSVHVAVRVDPQESDRQSLRFSRPSGGRRHRACGETVIAAEHQRHRPLVERQKRGLIELLTDIGDVVDIFLPLVAKRLRFRNRRREIAFIDDGAAEATEALAETGDAERGRPHVDAAAVAAEIERHADDVDLTHEIYNCTLGVQD
jgi:hypothetical protein